MLPAGGGGFAQDPGPMRDRLHILRSRGFSWRKVGQPQLGPEPEPGEFLAATRKNPNPTGNELLIRPP